MGLALPLALLGLLGVTIPLWIHRVRRRTLRELALPTIALLERAVSRRRRALSFRDRPLLYTRIAVAALFALALSKPFLSRVASYATERPIAIAIVLDDSMSMERKAQRGGTLFDAARARAERVLSELAPDSEAVLVLGGNVPRMVSARSNDIAGLRERLARLNRLGARGTALSEALSLGLRELAASKLSVKEALVLTDCTTHAAADALDSPAAHLRVECLDVRDARGNAYIASLALTRGREANEPHTLTVAVAAGPEQPELELSVRVDGKRVVEVGVAMTDGRGVAELPLTPTDLERGRVLEVRIETGNSLAEDDVSELSLDEASELSVLLVDGDPAPNQLDDELRFVALALALDDGQRAAPRLTRIDADGLSSIELAPFDVVVLANVRAPSDEDSARLERHVARGGGLLIASGEHVDAFAYRGRMASLLPAIPRSSAPSDPALTLDLEHVDSAELLPDRGAGLETTRTFERLLVEPPAAPNKTVLAFADGSPLLVAGRHGTGRIALLTTTLDDDWSDLPLTPGFLPLIHGLVRGLAAVDAMPKGPHPAGSVLNARVPLGASKLYLMTPDGRRVDLDPRRPAVRIDDTAVVGVYRAFAALDQQVERELAPLSFTVVADTRDSDLRVRRPKPERERPAQAGAGRARGVEGWFWLLLGLAALAEGALRLYARPRAQTALA